MNQVIKLEGDKDLAKKYNNFGSIYLQIMYSENKDLEPQFDPFVETLEDMKEKEYISGKFVIKCVHGKNLLPADLNGKSDPYLKIIFPDKKSKRIKEKSKTLFPIWNETVEYSFKD